MNAPIPVTIVTGFLGSGKTTLLSGLVKRRQTRRLALLINEFGEVAIDGALMRDCADASGQVHIHDFAYGLIAYGDDEQFVPTMQAIAQRRAHIDHVLIETSGLALPTAVMEVLQGPELAADFVLDATLAVVDTPQLLSDTFEPAVATLFDQQLEFADVVVLNKIDALNEDALLQAEEQVRSRAPNVRFLELAYDAQLDIRLALGLRLHQVTATSSQHAHSQTYTPVGMPAPGASVFANQTLLNGHAHSGLAAHTHGLATHKHFHEQDPGWLSFTLRSKSPQPTDKLKRALTEAAKVEPILRTKGFVNTTDTAATQLVQGVRARVTVTQAQQQSQTSKSELVFIGYHPSRARVAALLSDLTGTQWS